jgi:hypothetical protein
LSADTPSVASPAPVTNVTACMTVTQQDVSAVLGIQTGEGVSARAVQPHNALQYESTTASLLVRLSPR